MIDSIQNKFAKIVKSLENKRKREKEGLFVAEGLRFVREIPDCHEIEFYGVSEKFANENDLGSFLSRADVHIFSEHVFKEMSETSNPQGILAVVRKKKYSVEEVVKNAKENGFFVIAEELNDPGNLGTIIRTACACGCDGIFLSDKSVDVYGGKVLRSTMGAIFHVPVVSGVNIRDTVELLKRNGILVYAAHLKGKKYPYDLDLKKGCCFLVGNEARGLLNETAELSDEYVKIPMKEEAESLNASVAAAVLMYEVVRQRL
ncbi:MAG: RNA methyltransferase [Firmicutes bacterium]|nr:RNA methyltransferase [Bacillota bacterium]